MNTLQLKRDENGLYLEDGDLLLRADFSKELKRLKQSNLEKEMLVKAARIKGMDRKMAETGKRPLLLDATAGLGEDSLLLAAAGFEVMLYEYNPVISALLKDALERAANIPELKDIVSRMELFEENSIAAMKKIGEKDKESAIIPDVILLDPMFPARQKSALIKKKFQLLQQLEIPCDNEEELLNAAVSTGAGKIIIKRPLKGPYLAGRKPSYSYSGKAIRYDCIIKT